MTTPMLEQWPDWRDKVILELRLNDVSGPAIGDMLAEVEAHLAETGEHPLDAFGEPRAYARRRIADTPDAATGQVDAPRAKAPVWLTWGLDEVFLPELVIAAVCGLGGLLVGTAAFSVMGGDDTVAGMPAWIVLILGLVAAIGPLLVLPDDRIIDPRSGREARLGGPTIKGLPVLVWLVPLALSLGLGWFSNS